MKGFAALWPALALAALAPTAGADCRLTPAHRARADRAVRAVLARTGVPSASIALVRDHAIVYANAYGWAELENRRPAKPSMRYAVGSITKEFTAATLLLPQESGRLSIELRRQSSGELPINWLIL